MKRREERKSGELTGHRIARGSAGIRVKAVQEATRSVRDFCVQLARSISPFSPVGDRASRLRERENVDVEESPGEKAARARPTRKVASRSGIVEQRVSNRLCTREMDEIQKGGK